MTRILPASLSILRRLRRDTSGLALLELAFGMPVVLGVSVTGAELTNYITTRMRISQLALHLADNSARIGSGSQLQAKTISEADINDLLTGADMQSGELKLAANGRMIISSIEPDPDHPGKSMIRWQRCKGTKAEWKSAYGEAGKKNMDGIGPTKPKNRQVSAPPNGVTMFVEVNYQYMPLVETVLSPSSEISESASMMVRDRRDTSDDSTNADGTPNGNSQHPNGVYKVKGVEPANCGNGNGNGNGNG